MRTWRAIYFFAYLLIVVASASLLFAQGGALGTILGEVTDSTGAVVPGATVTIVNVATGATNHTTTTSSGDFTVPYLQPGTYQVTVEANGFEKAVADKVALVVGQQARINVALKPGAVSETVEVQFADFALTAKHDDRREQSQRAQGLRHRAPLHGHSLPILKSRLVERSPRTSARAA